MFPKEKIKKDKELRKTYVANIAMAFYDEYCNFKKDTRKQSVSKEDIHKIANRAAENFLTLLIDK